MRAYYYFNLVRYFGPVVLITEPLATHLMLLKQYEGIEAEFTPQIIKDLTDAAATACLQKVNTLPLMLAGHQKDRHWVC
jgi:hypothetical protein